MAQNLADCIKKKFHPQKLLHYLSALLGSAIISYLTPVVSKKLLELLPKDLNYALSAIVFSLLAVCLIRICQIALIFAPKKELVTPIEFFLLFTLFFVHTNFFFDDIVCIYYLILLLYLTFKYGQNLLKIFKTTPDSSLRAEDILLTQYEEKLSHTALNNKIHELIKSESYVKNIGLYGNWGVGKTVFAEKLFNQLREDGFVCVWLNLWGLKSSSNIITYYFESILKEISKDYYTYQSKSDVNNSVKSLISNQLLIPKDFLSELKIFTAINSSDVSDLALAINKPPKKIVIFMDNIERLSIEEVLTILQLINLLELTNLSIVNIVTYDKIQLSHSLEKNLNIHNGTTYLDKIFTTEYSIPNIDPLLVGKIIDDHYKNTIRALSAIEQSDFNIMWNANLLIKNFIFQNITTPRELIKILDKFERIILSHKTNINVLDALILCYIEVKYPLLFDTLKRKSSHIIYKVNSAAQDNKKTTLLKELNLNPIEAAELLTECVQTLFPNTKFPHPQDRDLFITKSFGHEKFYRRYFSIEPINEVYTVEDFNQLFKLTDEDFIKSLDVEKISNSWEEFTIQLGKTRESSRVTMLITDYLLRFISSSSDFSNDDLITNRLLDLFKLDGNINLQGQLYQRILTSYNYVLPAIRLYYVRMKETHPDSLDKLKNFLVENFSDKKSYQMHLLNMHSLESLFNFCFENKLLKNDFENQASANGNFALKLYALSAKIGVNVYNEKYVVFDKNHSIFSWIEEINLKKYVSNGTSNKDESLALIHEFIFK